MLMLHKRVIKMNIAITIIMIIIGISHQISTCEVCSYD